jgi:ATP-binding cassette subfamily F protein uup
MPLLTAQDLHKAYGITPILDGAALHLKRGEKIGLVGRNGTGKSTLLRILAGVEPADEGTLAWRSDTHVAYLPQNPDLSAAETLLDVALQGAAKCRTPLDPYEKQLAAEQALKGLGLTDPSLPVKLASGGTQRRAALAAALLQKPDLLLLDEPTNHLDADTAQWLQDQIRDLPSAVVLVTHDRYFLNQVVDRIVELRRGQMFSYEGTFQDYLETRLEEESLEGRIDQNRKNLLRGELDWLSRSPCARSTKQKARIGRAHALMTTEYEAPKAVQLPFLQTERLGKTILEAKQLSVGFAGRVLIESLDLLLMRGQRIGIVGPNGAGKTTLLRTLTEELPPLAGKLVTGQNTRIVGIDQQRTGLDPDETVMQAVHAAGGEYVQIGEQKLHVAAYLGNFLFKTADMQQQVATLSGGQKFRLLLARRLQEPMNVLVLDEPTNDLDFETLEVLEEALLQYPGCVLVVSHDRAFLDRVCTGILHVTGPNAEGGPGGAVVHTGNYSQFLARQAAERKADRQREIAARPVQTSGRQDDAPPKLTFAEEKRLLGIEAEIETAEGLVATLEARLADPVLAADYPQLHKTMQEHEAAVQARDALYDLWQTLEARQVAWLAWRKK